MERSVESKLTIYFDEPFWVGVFEELDGDKLSVCRTVFGAEPTDAEIYAFILKYFRGSLIIQCRAEVRKIYGRILSKLRRNTDVFQGDLAR